MSTSKGNTKRSRAQKYQNRTAFKNTLYDKSDFQKKLNNLHVSEVCTHCKGVIDWKIKYKKYKPLKQPKTCIKCQEKNVKKAYHVMCRECATTAKCCAKCLKTAEEVDIVPPEPTDEEQQKLKSEMDKLIKSLPERRRRSFLRYMAKGNKIEEPSNDNNIEEENDGATEKKKDIKRIPHTRETLLKKIDELKLDEDGDDSSSTDEDDGGDSFYENSDGDDENSDLDGCDGEKKQ